MKRCENFEAKLKLGILVVKNVLFLYKNQEQHKPQWKLKNQSSWKILANHVMPTTAFEFKVALHFL